MPTPDLNHAVEVAVCGVACRFDPGPLATCGMASRPGMEAPDAQ